MVTAGLQTIITHGNDAESVGLGMMDLTALRMGPTSLAHTQAQLPLGMLIPSLAALAALEQLPSLGWANVLGGLALVALGTMLYAIRRRGHPHEPDGHHDLVQQIETPLLREFRRPVVAATTSNSR